MVSETGTIKALIIYIPTSISVICTILMVIMTFRRDGFTRQKELQNQLNGKASKDDVKAIKKELEKKASKEELDKSEGYIKDRLDSAIEEFKTTVENFQTRNAEVHSNIENMMNPINKNISLILSKLIKD